MKKITGILMCSTLALMLGACNFGSEGIQNPLPEPGTTHAQLVGNEKDNDKPSDSDNGNGADVDLPENIDVTNNGENETVIANSLEYVKNYANMDGFVDENGSLKKAITCGYDYFEISEGYPELKKALDEKRIHDETEIADAKENGLDMWQTDDYDYEGEMGYMYVLKSYVSRADDRLFSFIEKNNSFFGGAHDSVYFRSYTYDSETGNQLELKDFIKDDGSLSKYLAEFLYNSYPEDMFYAEDEEELAATIAGMIYGGMEDFNSPVEFSVYNKGLLLYFNEYTIAPYASGIPVAYIDFNETPEYLNSEYFDKTSDNYTIEASEYTTLWIDVDNDNEKDNIQIGHKKEWLGFIEEFEYDGISVWELGDDYAEASVDMYTLGEPEVFFALINDKAYIFVQVEMYMGHYSIFEYSYNDGQLELIGEIPGYFHGLPTVGEFEVTAMFDLMSTYQAVARFKINEDGTYERVSDRYEIINMDPLPLVSSKDLYAMKVDENGKVLEEEFDLPAGTTFYFRYTDGADSVTFETSEGDYVLFENVGTSDCSICSYSLFEAFEQIWFAG